MTFAELEEVDRMMDAMEADWEPDEDPDADGYGWERAALGRIA